MRSRSILFVASLAIALAFVPSSSNGQEQERASASLIGGRTLDRGQYGVAAGGLIPSLWLQGTAGVTEGVDAGVRGDLYFMSPLGIVEVGPGAGLSAPMRFGLGTAGRTSFALKLAPDVVYGALVDDFCTRPVPGTVECYDGTGGAVGMEVGVLGTIPASRAGIIVGITSPAHVAFIEGADGADLIVPLTLNGGVEYPIDRNVSVFGYLQPGITIHSVAHEVSPEPFFRLWAGLQSAI